MAEVRDASSDSQPSATLDEIAILLRRATFAGLLPPDGIGLSEENWVAGVKVISENMALVGLPVAAFRGSLLAGQAWSRVLESASAQRMSLGAVDSATLEKLTAAIRGMNDQIEMSPQPVGEWGPVVDTLGEDLVASLVAASVSSVRRYRAGTRSTPQQIAERLHFLALVLADLAGSYNGFGMRRWFSRPREALQGRSPQDLLGEFDIDGPDAQSVARLAAGLAGAGAA